VHQRARFLARPRRRREQQLAAFAAPGQQPAGARLQQRAGLRDVLARIALQEARFFAGELLRLVRRAPLLRDAGKNEREDARHGGPRRGGG
jgi:hypothetical protein